VKARWWCAPVLMAALAGPLLQAQVPAPISLTLTDAERIALSNSEALRIQNLRIQSASRRYTLGIRDYLPQLELAFASSNGVNVGALDTPSNQLSVSLREPIYNGGRTAMQRSLSRLELILSRHASAVARADVLNDAWDKYHQVLVLQAQKAVKQDALRQMRKQLEIAQTERGIGMIREIDLLDVELSVSNQEMDLESTESDLEQAFYALKRSLGMSPDQTVALVGSIDSSYQGIRIDKLSSWFFSVAQENNADLQSANYKVTQMEAQVAMTRAQFLPQIGATVSLLVSGPGFPRQGREAAQGAGRVSPRPPAPPLSPPTPCSPSPVSSTRSMPSWRCRRPARRSGTSRGTCASRWDSSSPATAGRTPPSAWAAGRWTSSRKRSACSCSRSRTGQPRARTC
jgi:outer membrane protein TolC